MPVQEIKLKAASDAPSKSGLENVPPDQLERAMKAAMARNDSELDLSEEEQNKFTKAFQDKEFRKMMAEYVDEISDPKHRAEQDAYIREMEAKGETPKDKRVIHPSAGFNGRTFQCIPQMIGCYQISDVTVCDSICSDLLIIYGWVSYQHLG